ncbi:preprotein translocase subunit SecE [Amycolatopsis antarctica]|uniref:Protein translocase subunit SecE n=1 Tax=Amycolatopsis antarctica TaxID=1854586 RepID=A0A263D8K0_9PSEU|nr:preprotein translocase subunit SecE [Amycolatopsis antarctica]OZM74832.1 preprotein translocase subunit SecE [Amycolatopsis antarctica]
MSEDGEKDQEKEPKRPSRPVTAAARRERRASARPAAGKAAGSDADEASKRPAKKDKAAAAKAKADGKDKPTPKRDSKDKKASLFARIGRFVREVWAELRKVIWPTRKQMVTYTSVVLVFVAFMIGLVAVLDLVFLKGMDFVFGN